MSDNATQRGKSGLSLYVAHAREGSPVAVGSRFDVSEFPALIGRSRHAHARLDDPTVSREHLRIDIREDALWIVPLSERANTWWNGRKLESCDGVCAPLSDCTLQVGGVLLRVEALEVTEPFGEGHLEPELPLVIRRSGDGIDVRLFGYGVELHRGPALTLWRLVRQSGDWVSNESLLEELDSHYDRAMSRNINQLVTYIRTALHRLISREGLETRTRAALEEFFLEREEAVPPSFESADSRTLCRHLVRNKRGFGHRLSLVERQVQALRVAQEH